MKPPAGLQVLGASSDHLVLSSGRHPLAIGIEVSMQVNYSALVRAMTSPFVSKVLRSATANRRAGISRTTAADLQPHEVRR